MHFVDWPKTQTQINERQSIGYFVKPSYGTKLTHHHNSQTFYDYYCDLLKMIEEQK